MQYAICIVPVLAFLIALVVLDTFRLLRPRVIGTAFLAGGAAALIAYSLYLTVAQLSSPQPAVYTTYVGPFSEELLKAAYLVFLIQSRRVGFMMDAAICGFAVGAGFAIVENLFYLQAIESAAPAVCVLRGCGTAAMHGSATALFGIVARSRAETRRPLSPTVLLPGLVLAVAIHILFNRFLGSPLVATVLIVVVVPLIMVAVFRHSERSLRRWLAVGFDTDAELLRMLSSGNFITTRAGQYLISLKTVLPAKTVVDMFCLLRIHVELSLLAKGALMMRQAGYTVPARPEVAEQFVELEHLKQSIGHVGWLTLRPLLNRSRHELWQLTVLAER